MQRDIWCFILPGLRRGCCLAWQKRLRSGCRGRDVIELLLLKRRMRVVRVECNPGLFYYHIYFVMEYFLVAQVVTTRAPDTKNQGFFPNIFLRFWTRGGIGDNLQIDRRTNCLGWRQETVDRYRGLDWYRRRTPPCHSSWVNTYGRGLRLALLSELPCLTMNESLDQWPSTRPVFCKTFVMRTARIPPEPKT